MWTVVPSSSSSSASTGMRGTTGAGGPPGAERARLPSASMLLTDKPLACSKSSERPGNSTLSSASSIRLSAVVGARRSAIGRPPSLGDDITAVDMTLQHLPALSQRRNAGVPDSLSSQVSADNTDRHQESGLYCHARSPNSPGHNAFLAPGPQETVTTDCLPGAIPEVEYQDTPTDQ